MSVHSKNRFLSFVVLCLSEIELLAGVTKQLSDAEHISCNLSFLLPYHFSFFAPQTLMTMKMQSIPPVSRAELPRSSYIS